MSVPFIHAPRGEVCIVIKPCNASATWESRFLSLGFFRSIKNYYLSIFQILLFSVNEQPVQLFTLLSTLFFPHYFKGCYSDNQSSTMRENQSVKQFETSSGDEEAQAGGAADSIQY